MFCVTDLLVHLSQEQLKKTLGDGITGENLNILVGSRPLDGDDGDSQRIKLAAMQMLHER